MEPVRQVGNANDTVRPDPTIRRHLDDPITQHMRRDFSRLHVNQTVGEALDSIRKQSLDGRVIYFYVMDDDDRLRGVVPTRRLLLNSSETKIADIMVRDVVTISHQATVLDACEFFTFHKLLAFPIVDDGRHILGVVDVELYTTELSEVDRSERNEYLFQLIGVHLTDAQQSAPVLAFRRRFPWLLCNIGAGIIAAFISRIYEEELKTVVALALFIPVVLALAESVSIQSVSLALSALQGPPRSWRAIGRRLRSEAVLGVLLGAACGIIVAIVSWIWLGQPRLGLSLFGGIAGGITAAAVIGVAIPNILHRLKLDPSVAAGPIALAGADMVTLLVYFNLARWLLS